MSLSVLARTADRRGLLQFFLVSTGLNSGAGGAAVRGAALLTSDALGALTGLKLVGVADF